MRACFSTSFFLFAFTIQLSAASLLGIRRISSPWVSRPFSSRSDVEKLPHGDTRISADASSLLLKYSCIRGGATASNPSSAASAANAGSDSVTGHCIGIDLGTTYR